MLGRCGMAHHTRRRPLDAVTSPRLAHRVGDKPGRLNRRTLLPLVAAAVPPRQSYQRPRAENGQDDTDIAHDHVGGEQTLNQAATSSLSTVGSASASSPSACAPWRGTTPLPRIRSAVLRPTWSVT